MGDLIRTCRPEDVPAVADLFATVFLRRKAPAPDSLVKYFNAFIFDLPSREPDISSLVFVDAAGAVRGFQGVIPHRILLNGKPLRAAVGCALMVDRPEAHPTAGARLVRSFLKGPQDLAMSESANRLAQKMWLKVGGERCLIESMDWFRILQPAGFALWKTARLFSPAALLRPITAVADRVMTKLIASGFNPPAIDSRYSERDVDNREVIAALPKITDHYSIRPVWNEATLQYMLSHASAKTRNGGLVRRIIYDRNDRPSGCYLYYAKSGDVGVVLQILALPHALGATIDSLIRHAHAVGCVGVRGRTQHDLLDPLLDRNCLFVPCAATLIYSKSNEIMSDIRTHSGLFTGLAGESWCGLTGGSFN